MEDALDALNGAVERRGIAQIAGHIFEGQIRNRAIGARGAQKHAHFVAASHKLPCHVAAQEPRRACDQRGHATFTPSSLARASCSTRWPVSSTVCAAFRSPLTTGSTNLENNSHHMLPIILRASAELDCTAAAIVPPGASVMPIPSTSDERKPRSTARIS